MPPANKKDCSIILFDLAAEPRETALQTLMKISCNNFANDSKDLTKLILLNSDITENRLHKRKKGYNCINEVGDNCILYDPKLLLGMIGQTETGEANWLEGLHVALTNLKEEYQDIGGIITYQVLFITDLKSPLKNYDKSLIDKITQIVNELDAFLYVVGPEIAVPFTIKSQKHVQLWMKNLQIDSENQNLTILKKIIAETKNSVVCNYKIGIHLFFSYRNWGGSQPWQVPLGIGRKIELPTQTMKVLNDTVPCKLVSTEGALRQPAWIDAEDESIEIDASDVISGIMRHEKFVQMPDNKMFQVSNPRSFSVLCFTDSSNIPEYVMRGGGCYCVLPNSTPDKNEAFNILIDCLAQQNKYVVARRIYNANFVPKIVALLPKPDHNPKCFILTPLPFAEDVRLNYREKRVEKAPKVETVDEVINFLDSINIDSDRSVKNIPLGINMMLNSNSQRIVNKAADKYLDKHMNLEELDIDLFEPPTGDAVDGLKNIWPDRTIEVKTIKEDDNEGSDDDFNW